MKTQLIGKYYPLKPKLIGKYYPPLNIYQGYTTFKTSNNNE